MLIPHIKIQFTAPVWRMQIDESTDVVCLEIRDPENKCVCFSSIDLSTGEQYVKNLTLPHGWQCGLDAAVLGVVLIHGYQSEVLPVRKGLTAIDIKTGKVLWENHNINLEKIHQTGIEVYDTRVQPKKVILTDIRTGVAVIARIVTTEFTSDNLKYPEVPADQLIINIKLIAGAQRENMLFLEHNGYRILSLHALASGAVTQYLYVYNKAGDIVFEDIIAQNIQKLQPEAFIVYKNKLIWLQNTSVLKVLLL